MGSSPPEIHALDGGKEEAGVEPAGQSTRDSQVGELWEAEQDVLSLQQIKDALGSLAAEPPIAALLDIVDRVGLDTLREAVAKILTAPPDRPIDDFGLDPVFYDEIFPAVEWLHDRYFRVTTTGAENVPESGRVLVVANHSGTLPYDAAMLATTVRIHHPMRRHLRPLVENFVYYMPYLGRFMARAGAVRACQENATALLEADQAVLVFPEGVKGVGKLYKKRYRLQRFGRGGAIKLALRTGSPIVPAAIVGAEEAMPLVGKVTWLAGPLGIPYIPITPTLPLLGPLGLVPYPTKWFIDFGEPVDISAYGKDAVNDRLLVHELNEQVRDTIQNLIADRLAKRRTVFRG